MGFYVGITDQGWMDHLREVGAVEANFWRPSSSESRFTAIKPGELFLFKQHKRNGDSIVGGGTYVESVRLSIFEAWNTFGDANGASSLNELLERIRVYREKKGRGTHASDELVCIVLSNIFFLPESLIIDKPADWADAIVSGKTYSWSSDFGVSVRTALQGQPFLPETTTRLEVKEEVVDAFTSPWGKAYLTRSRVGQGILRMQSLENYQSRCCFSGESLTEALECAHIQPLALAGAHELSNTLVLRSDLHTLFDLGLLGIGEDLTIRVSSRIPIDSNYRSFEGKSVAVGHMSPSLEAIKWHTENVFLE